MLHYLYHLQLNSNEVWDKLGYKMSGYQTSGRVASHQLANEAAIAAVMESVRKYVFADKLMAPIKQRLEKWAEIKDQEESEREWAKIQADARIMAEQYNPEGRGLKKLRGNYSNEQIGAMRFSEVVNTYEGQKSLYDMLKSVNDPDIPYSDIFMV